MMKQEYKRAQTKTHPWDGDIEDTRYRMAWVSLLFTALFFILFQSSTAQKVILFPDPDITDIETGKLSQKLTISERQVAEDYQEITSKLEFIIRNHLEYFSDYKQYEGRKYQNLLLKTLINIEKGLYCSDAELLVDDLTKLKTSLKSEEEILNNNHSLHKLYKNVRTLRSDIEMIEEILQDDIIDQLENHKSSKKGIEVFLRQNREFEKQKEEYQVAMYELQELLNEQVNYALENSESLHILFNDEIMSELFESEKLQKELEEVLNMVFTIKLPKKILTPTIPFDSLGNEIVIPEIQPNFFYPSEPPDVPDVPESPDIQYHYDYKYDTQSDKAMLSNQYIDSVLVKSSKIPIFINNQIGDLEVQGWDRNKIIAEYSYDVVSNDYNDAKKFLESITLKMDSDKSGIHISSEFPSLHNTKRQVVNSTMILYVPQKNVLYITNSFGRTDISNMKNDLILNANNSDIIVDNIAGNVISKSKNGSLSFQDIEGNITISSTRGNVIVENSKSLLSITNSHAQIIVSDCQGDATLENSGEIFINDHIGNIDISNDNGQTTIETLTGNLILEGSYKPFYITSINGSVDIENKNASITISEVTGKSIVQNKNGLIKAQNIQGPIDFSNYGGEIYFIANNLYTGNSTIQSDYGKVNIVLPQDSDILLNASTEGGSIVNSYKTKIEKNDFLFSTIVSLGNKSKKLDVTGTNSTIIINDK